ncbi:MAG: GPW/gp25 family protein [Bryobacteraceae bacterium]
MIDQIQGFQFPFRIGGDGKVAQLSGAAKVRQDLMLLLGTRLGERAMRRDYGTRLASLVHDPNDDVLADLIREEVKNAMLTWEPRVAPLEIRVTQNEAELTLYLTYVLVQDSRTERMVVPLA